MKRLAFVLGVILVGVILCLPSDAIAQDPNDPGEPDTLYFTPGGVHSPDGETLFICPDHLPEDVIIHINGWNDNDITALMVVLRDDCNGPPCNADLDPAKNNLNELPKCFEGSRVEYFDWHVCKLFYFPPTFYVGAIAHTGLADPMPPGDGLLATLIFTASDTGRICLDTTFHFPSMQYTVFVTDGQGYMPIFKKKTFVIANREYSQADPNYDGLTNVGDVVYLINYVLKDGPIPCVLQSGDMNCDGTVDIVDITYLINYLFRSGPEPGYCP